MHGATGRVVIRAADAALLEAKAKGRDRSEIAPTDAATDAPPKTPTLNVVWSAGERREEG